MARTSIGQGTGTATGTGTAPRKKRKSPALGLGDERVGGEPLSEVPVTCPWCGEEGIVVADVSGGLSQSYVEDCEVCCRPRTVHVAFEDEGPVVQVARDD